MTHPAPSSPRSTASPPNGNFGDINRTGAVPADLDRSIIDELRALGGTHLVDEIISLACADMYRSLGLLDVALVEGDASSVARLAHTISGLCANIGAIAVVDTAKALERLALTGNLNAAPALSFQLLLRWHRAKDALIATPDGQGAAEGRGPVASPT
jgi:HPt (histidine-containing phosphotransfer) domain-containing protein